MPASASVNASCVAWLRIPAFSSGDMRRQASIWSLQRQRLYPLRGSPSGWRGRRQSQLDYRAGRNRATCAIASMPFTRRTRGTWTSRKRSAKHSAKGRSCRSPIPLHRRRTRAAVTAVRLRTQTNDGRKTVTHQEGVGPDPRGCAHSRYRIVTASPSSSAPASWASLRATPATHECACRRPHRHPSARRSHGDP